MNDEQLAGIEALEARGFVFVLKWDGARTSRKRTIVVSNPGLGLSFRRDGDDHSQLIDEALSWADTTIDEGDS